MANKRNQQNNCQEQNCVNNCGQQSSVNNSNGTRNAQSKKSHGSQNNKGNNIADCKE